MTLGLHFESVSASASEVKLWRAANKQVMRGLFACQDPSKAIVNIPAQSVQ